LIQKSSRNKIKYKKDRRKGIKKEGRAEMEEEIERGIKEKKKAKGKKQKFQLSITFNYLKIVD
jgi:hypothetical protein